MLVSTEILVRSNWLTLADFSGIKLLRLMFLHSPGLKIETWGTRHQNRRLRESMIDHWFKADVVFDCPNCGKRSVETLIANASRHNPGGVAEGVRKTVAPLTCRVCNKPAPEGQPFQIGMNEL